MNTRNRINSTIDRQTPTLPPGRPVHLPGRGDTFVRESSGPVGAPTVVLLHGWTATADLNWHHSFETLARHYRVIAVDHRGHGRGLRTDGAFSLTECADDLRRRLIGLFVRDEHGRRPCHGYVDRLQNDPRWRDNITFNEYFHGDNGAGLGATHQTGWTGLVADLICRPDPLVTSAEQWHAT